LKLSKSIIFDGFRKEEFFILGLHLKQKLDKTLMHNSYSTRAFKRLSAPEKLVVNFIIPNRRQILSKSAAMHY